MVERNLAKVDVVGSNPIIRFTKAPQMRGFFVYLNRHMEENPAYLSTQLITYLGNKRRLLPLIGKGVAEVQKRLGKERLRAFDAFAGSGVVSRYLKRYCSQLYSNDLEAYSAVLNRCYLTNASDIKSLALPPLHREVLQKIEQNWAPGLIAELYAPQNDDEIRPGERVFYTRRNAIFLDSARRAIDSLPPQLQHFFLAPLLCEASVHTNTSGIFKGFYKNSAGIGQFGGNGRNALQRILADISLPLPIFSRFDCECHVLQQDATAAAADLPELDVAYLDPPYNQHPYASNYFMLNFILDYKRPQSMSTVSGIPQGWNHSPYNSRKQVAGALQELLQRLPCRFVLLSYNSEGFISPAEMEQLLRNEWHIEIMQQDYATFRGCRNLRNRALKVKEFLYLLERR